MNPRDCLDRSENAYHKSGKNQAPAPDNAPSSRPSSRLEFGSPDTPEPCGTPTPLGTGSIPCLGIADTSPARPLHHKRTDTSPVRPHRHKRTHLTREELERIEGRLTARDHAVLMAIRKYRFLTSAQIGRLYVTGCSTKTSQTRHRNLLLKRLADHGLIRPLERRVGGDGGGSSLQVWHLTEAGYRLLTLNDPDTNPRKRFREPSALFLRHSLAVAECAVQMVCLCRDSYDLDLEQVDAEPACWRCYRDADGKVCQLRPDLYAITNYDGYEDHWFIEMDLGSESAADVLGKCDAYLRYYYTGVEQRETGMFPLVVWFINDENRKEMLKECITEHLRGHPQMFLVTSPDEMEKMLRQDIDRRELC